MFPNHNQVFFLWLKPNQSISTWQETREQIEPQQMFSLQYEAAETYVNVSVALQQHS